ncbi:DNA-directed RNA polymerase subunit A' [Euryarchaeota archaeon]|nr:DNA-directed RNA polymerase subunit A' [Euryarchaeota archaeon]MDA8609731.1 DNA-directed RNA polymerase subunit A' [Euryarchaeota archaeon]MDA8700723.1 DNA-directed RNA polymerase subunit A' [Euryarchaeota archaeon]
MSQTNTMIPKRIAQIRFGLMEPKEIRQMSAVEVKTADTYKDDGHAYRQGLMDPHMGVIEPGLVCPTDNCKYDESPGHFGHIALELPVIHIGFVNLIKTALKATCSKCSRILLHDTPSTHPSNPELSEQDYYRTRIRDIQIKHGVGSTEFAKIIKEVEKVTTGTRRGQCMHCQAMQGKIMLDKPTTFKEKLESQGAGKAEIERKLNPRDVREWLSAIPSDDLIFIGMDKKNRPEWIVLKVLPVPPITVRPSITLDSGDRSEDDLTHKLVDVLRINQRLRENRDTGAPQLIVEDLWELLQYHITTYFDNQTSGIPPARHRSGRTLKTLTQRLKGKEGRFRSNLSGKRVNFCARSVISPDPYLGVNEVGVPKKIAKELTVPIRVTSRNREQMRQMILRGPDVHPGVNYIIRGDNRRVRINQRSRLINAGFRCHNPECNEETTLRPDMHQCLPAPNFLPGLVIKPEIFVNPDGTQETTYVVDDEATLANLRGEDIDSQKLAEDDPRAKLHYRWMHELAQADKVHPDPHPEHLQISCPHCGSPSDEWGDQTRVEDRLSTIDRNGNPKPGLLVERHLIDGDVAIFNRQPSLHRMSMMVHEVRVMEGHTFRFNLAVCTPYNADFDGDEMNLHVIQSEEARAEAKILMRVQEHILTPRYGGAVIGGIHDHISGAYLLSRPGTLINRRHGLEMLGSIDYIGELPEIVKDENGKECFRGQDIISLIIPDNIHLRFRSRSNDDVVVKNGMVEGTLDKRAIGAEDGRLLDAIVQTNGPELGAKFLDDFTRLSIAACTSLGFTTGIDDEDLSAEALQSIKNANIEAGVLVQAALDKFGKEGRGYETRPGRTPRETLEEDIMVILDQGKQEAGDVAKNELAQSGSTNAAVNMAISGARGSMDNLNMMAGSIGQAKVRGKRLERGYNERVLPHFRRGGRAAADRGFISSSFKRGLEPTEFFMLSISGRESLVDTAVRTAKSGYMQRRLINAMDDLKVYDDSMLSVRNTANRIIQFSYGEDGIDPSRGVHGSPFNIDVIVDEALGTEGATVVERDSFEREEKEEDFGGIEYEDAGTDGGEN